MVRNILKYISIGCLLLIAILFIVGNFASIFLENKQKEFSQSLEEMVQEMNKHLPIKNPISDINIGSLTHIFINKECVVWKLEIDSTFFYPKRISMLQPESMNAGILSSGTRDDIIDIDTLLSKDLIKKHQECSIMYYYLFAKQNSTNHFYEELMSRNYSQKWIYKSPFSDRQFEFVMTHKEMKAMEERCKYQYKTAMKDFLELYKNRQSDLVKVASANSDIKVEFIVEPSAFIYRYTFSKDYYKNGNRPIENLRKQYDELQADAEMDLNTIPIFNSSKEIAKEYHHNIIIKYRDYNLTDSIEIVAYQYK